MRRVFLPPQQFGCRNPSPVWRVSQVLVILVGLIMVGEAQEAGPIVPEGPRPFLHFEREPEYDLPELKFLHEKGVIPLWLKALKRTEDELTLRVAEALLVAWNMGFSEVNKDIGDDLLEAFQKTQDVTARIGLARVLIAMDVKNASDLFAAAVTPDSYSLCEVLEPALARWGHEPTIKRNLARLNDQNTLDVWKRLAIQVLGESSSTQAHEVLIQIVRDSSGRPDLRQLSARALGQLVSEGLLAEAKALLSPEYRSDGLALLLAAEMTTNHSGAETEDFLKRLAQQGGTTVQAIALRHLQRLSPQSVVDLATGAGQEQFHVNHPHNGVRQTICESCYLVGSLETVDILLTYLDDAHPGNRQLAADALYRLAQQDSLRAAVIGGVTDSLRHPSWRTLEKACELSAFLNLSKSQEQVVVLLNHEIPEVAAAAAFAIKEFDLDSTTGPALARLNENLRQQFALNVDEQIHRYRFTSRQTQHLCEHLGRRQVRDADPILRGFIPKRVENGEVVREPWCRSTAIWALGRIHDGELDAGLASLLRARLNDVDSLVPESDQVREASAYALGWFGDRESLESFQRFLSRKSPTRGVGHACAWAKEKLTGETVPVLPVLEQTLSSDWFLRPVKPMPSESAN